MQRHQVAIARGKVNDGLNAEMILDQPRQGNAAHAHTRHRAIGDIDAVHTGFLQQRRAFQYFAWIQTFGWIEFYTDDKFSGSKFLLQTCLRTLLRQDDLFFD